MWAHPGKKLLVHGWRIWAVGRMERDGKPRLASCWKTRCMAACRNWFAISIAFTRRRVRCGKRMAKPAGFQWIDADNASENIVSFIRRSPTTGREIICVGNFAPVLRENHRLGLPRKGTYRLILNSDAEEYGGRGVKVAKTIKAAKDPANGQGYSALITLPPLSILWFEAPTISR